MFFLVGTMDYLGLLNHSYDIELHEEPELSKEEYLAEHVFDFTTYDSKKSVLFGEWCVKVCKAITDKKTFDFIEIDDEHYRWYLLMINMPFFENRLSWGGSIRGAWWDLYGDNLFTLNSCGLYEEGVQLLEIKLNSKQWNEFINAIAIFSSREEKT